MEDPEWPKSDIGQEFYKDEWIPVILPHDQDATGLNIPSSQRGGTLGSKASTPSPVEIARLFQEAAVGIWAVTSDVLMI